MVKIMERIRMLKDEVKRRGFMYKLVKKGSVAYVYSKQFEDTISYEVFKIRTKRDRIINGKLIPGGEWFPHDEAFGDWAWSRYTEEGACALFDVLERRGTPRCHDS